MPATALGLRDPMDRGIVQEVRFESANTNNTTSLLSGMVAWWKAESNFLDRTSFGNNGTPQGGQNFAPGEVGLAFNVTNGTEGVEVPGSSSLRRLRNITIRGHGFIRLTSIIMCPLSNMVGIAVELLLYS